MLNSPSPPCAISETIRDRQRSKDPKHKNVTAVKPLPTVKNDDNDRISPRLWLELPQVEKCFATNNETVVNWVLKMDTLLLGC